MKILDDIHTKLFYNSHFYRDTIRFMESYFKDTKDLIGVEIGVNTGHHAFCMLYHLPIKKLYLVDPFVNNEFYADMNNKYFETQKLLDRYKDKVIFIKDFSSNAIDEISDELDFVYIDGDHSYDIVKNDIELYSRKIKKGGILSGHDFDANHLGVVKAVCEHMSNNGILNGTKSEWWIIN